MTVIDIVSLIIKWVFIKNANKLKEDMDRFLMFNNKFTVNWPRLEYKNPKMLFTYKKLGYFLWRYFNVERYKQVISKHG